MKLTLGTVQFGLDYGVQHNGKPSFEQAIQLLNSAYEEGITSFDTAQAYGNAEEILGMFLANGIQREKVSVISKLSTNEFNTLDPSQWKSHSLYCIENSLRNLQIDFLDGYLLHNAALIYEPAAIAALVELRNRNYCRNIGVSVYTPNEALKALEYDDIDYIQIPYNVLDNRLDRCGFFELAKRKEVKVYARSVLLQGLLLIPISSLPPKMEYAKKTLETFELKCNEANISKIEAAISSVYHHPGIDSIVFGTDCMKQLMEFIMITQKSLEATAIIEFQQLAEGIDQRIISPNLW